MSLKDLIPINRLLATKADAANIVNSTDKALHTIKGWVKSKRDSKGGFSFISLNDGSCFDSLQIVANRKDLDNYNDVLAISAGCSLSVTGHLVASQGKGQSVEIQATQITVLGWVEDPDTYPIAKKRHSFEYLRQVAHLRPRTNTFAAISRIRHCLASAIHRYFDEQGFAWVNTPIITTNDCEGAGELFRVSTLDAQHYMNNQQATVDYTNDFFGDEAFLTVSGQLNLETHCMALSKVYTFGPTFRAENSNTSRHLAEFWMVEPEMAFADLNDDADAAQSFLRYVIAELLERRQDDLAFFNQQIDKGLMERLQQVCASDCVKMSYTDAIAILTSSNKNFDYDVKWGIDLHTEHERFLAENYVKGPLIITDYPKDIKAFYMRLNDDEKTVAAMDVLVPGIGEIIGGSQREERLAVYDKRIQEHAIKGDLSWYRDLRRYGTVPHAGFGLGFERLINYVTGMENIRDAIPFPRTPKSARF